MLHKCLFKRLYDKATPYVQLLGWLVITGSVVLSGMAAAQKVEAFDGRLNIIERAYIDNDKRFAVIDGKLDVLIERVR
jgi:hypothetical protein